MMRSDNSLERIIILAVLILNIYVRFSGLGDFSLSNDELSAVSRLDASSFSELIENGVVATDPHPAGSQVMMYYWTSIFGKSPLAIRFPFAAFGLLSFFFLYLTFKRWIGFQRAILAVSFMSVLEFTIIHGQLARPYALGLFSTSVFVWAWDRFVLACDKRKWIRVVYVLSAALSCYSHYYAGLFAGIVGISGIISVSKKGLILPYLLMNVAVIVLFLPHLSITLAQLTREQLTGWIPLPESDFISSHIFTLLNKSSFILTLFLILSLISLIRMIRFERDKLPFLYYATFFFLAPILIGYIYTLYAGPALMDRVLLYSAPYFLVMAFMALPNFKRPVFLSITVLLTLVTVASTALETSFANRDYTENFREIGLVHDEIIGEYKESNVLVTGNYNSPRYLDFYTDKPVSFAIDRLVSDSLLAVFMKEVRYSENPYLFHSWACMYQSVESVEYARLFYSRIVEQAHFYNSGYWFFSKEAESRDTMRYVHFTSDSSSSNIPDLNAQYSNLFRCKMADLNGAQVVNARVKFKNQHTDGMILVIQVKNENGENLMWKGKNLGDFAIDSDDNEVIISYVIPSDLRDSDELYVYFWNSKDEEFSVDEIWISVFADSFYPDLI